MKFLLLFLVLISKSVLAQEIFLAKFKTLNSQINGTIAGSTTVYINGPRFLAYTRLFAGFPGAWHMQNMYTGKRCPTIEDDTNGDGHIDILEAQRVTGKIILPLDGDLNSQQAGYYVFPVADDFGNYFYEKEANLNLLLKDLRSPDSNPNDNLVKLGRNEPLVPEGKVVLIQGVTNAVQFPETVATSPDGPTFQTIPIACGVLRRN